MFLRNAWYMAMWVKDLGEKPLARTRLNDKIVFYRKSMGEIGAIHPWMARNSAIPADPAPPEVGEEL